MTWTDWTLISIIVGLLLCPPKYDLAIMWKEWLENRNRDRLPECFGRVLLLHPHHRAENGCHDCPHKGGCLELSKATHPALDLDGWVHKDARFNPHHESPPRDDTTELDGRRNSDD